MATVLKTVAKKVYDVAVFGPDVGGAAAAALSARRGLRTFNMGVGMCVVVRRRDAQDAIEALKKRGQAAFEIGAIEAAPGLSQPEVVVQG